MGKGGWVWVEFRVPHRLAEVGGCPAGHGGVTTRKTRQSFRSKVPRSCVQNSPLRGRRTCRPGEDRCVSWQKDGVCMRVCEAGEWLLY